MTRFSQRKGITSVSKPLQFEYLDDELRNRLWSALKVHVWDHWHPESDNRGREIARRAIEALTDSIWVDYFKKALDTRPYFAYTYETRDAYHDLRDHFMHASWYEVYDFLEFVLQTVYPPWADELRARCNKVLEEENAATRIVGNQVAEITTAAEISEVETALQQPLSTISEHLQRALELMSSKLDPDYRNSIKESISAVEACCQYLTGDKSATLGKALKQIDPGDAIHQALKNGFGSIYGFTSDSGGIRHALTEGGHVPSHADAKFMLVACSAFVNFLLAKAAEGNVEIG